MRSLFEQHWLWGKGVFPFFLGLFQYILSGIVSSKYCVGRWYKMEMEFPKEAESSPNSPKSQVQFLKKENDLCDA